MGVDAGSISSSVRIRLDQLNADINACKTAFDQLGGNLAASAANYANITGKQYFAALKKIQTETDNITAAAKAGALTQQQATAKLIQLRQQELAILQKRAISEAGSNKATIDAIKNTEAGLQKLVEKQKALGGETEKSSFITQKLASLLTFAGVVGGVTAVIGAIKKSVLAFQEAEVSAQRLDLALKLNGMEKSRGAMYQFASTMQNLTGVSDDYVVQLQAQLVAQGRSESQIKDLITAAAGLSAVTGDDLGASLEQLNKTYEGIAPRSSALKALTDDLTEAQLRNGEGIKIVKEKYEGYIGAVGTTKIANDRLKESFGDYLESIGRGFATTTSGMQNAATTVLTQAAKIKNAQLDAQDAINARKKGTATVDQQILALETLMFNEQNKGSQIAGANVAIYNSMRLEVEKQKTALDDLNKATTKNSKEETDRQNNILTVRKKLKDAEEALKKVNNAAAQNKKNAQLLEELDNWKLYKKTQEEAAASIEKLTSDKEQDIPLTDEMKKKQDEYNKSIEQSIRNQRESGDDQGGLNERITLTKEYINQLIAQGANTDLARKALAGYQYQLGTLKNTEKLDQVERSIALIGLSTDELKKKQREQAIADIRNGQGSQESKDAIIAKLKEQYAAEDELAQADANKKLATSAQDYQDKLDALNGVVKDQVEVERARALALIDNSGATDEAMAESKKIINEYFDALAKSKGPEAFAANMKKVSDVVGKVSDFIKDALGSIDEAIQATYDKMVDAAEVAAEEQEKIMDGRHDSETEALDEEYAHKQELLENDGLTNEEHLNKKVADAILAGDTEAQAEAEKELKKFQLQEEYAAKQKELEDRQAKEDEDREALAAHSKAGLEYRSAVASWKIKMAVAIADGIAAVINAIATTPGGPIIKGISGAATGTLVGLSIGSLNKAKPTMPALATGGIILPRAGGVPVIAAENGYPELALNTGPSGQALLQDFADRIVAGMGSAGKQTQNVFPITLIGTPANYRELYRNLISYGAVIETARRG